VKQDWDVATRTSGKVFIVGAGPGDAGLLTLRAASLLGRADVVLHDALVGPGVMAMVPDGAERVDVGKRAGGPSAAQAEVNALMVKLAREGKRVVRLKGGDPFVFGRGGEEAEALAEAGVEFEVVPGVSSAVAAPAYAGIPVTHREMASGFTVVTGHEAEGKGGGVDWGAVAGVPGTKVVLMCGGRMGEVAGALVKGGMQPGTPVALVRSGTTARQEVVVSTLEGAGEAARRMGNELPVLAVIGEVVRLRDRLDWWSRRRLAGVRVVVTRAREQGGVLAQRLAELGAEVLEVPTIRIERPEALGPLMEAVLGIGEYDWLVFTSANGVTSFLDVFLKAYHDLRSLGNVRIAAVGPTTAARVKERGLAVDVMPERYLAKDVAKAIAAHETVENQRYLLLRAESASPELPRLLEEMGGIVDDVGCYRTVPEEGGASAVAALVESGADWLTFTSSSTVENFHRRFDLPSFLARHPGTRMASIGPETSKALHLLGLKPTVEARRHDLEGLVEVLVVAVHGA
jgi:uroporphyrinogen III methyltransferase/synthase